MPQQLLMLPGTFPVAQSFNTILLTLRYTFSFDFFKIEFDEKKPVEVIL